MKKRICGVIAQHFWELPSPLYPEGGEQAARDALLGRLDALTKAEHVERFVVTMERGFPLDIASAVLALRSSLGTELECVIPYEEQHITWPEDVRDCYFQLISQCDKETMIQHPFSLDCYQKTLKHLLSCCDCFLILWNGRQSDAGDAVQLIRRKGLPLMLLDPSQLQEPLH